MGIVSVKRPLVSPGLYIGLICAKYFSSSRLQGTETTSALEYGAFEMAQVRRRCGARGLCGWDGQTFCR